MSPIATPYVAFDVSKRTLQVEGPCRESQGKIQNEAAAIMRELRRLRRLYPALHLVCEATGGYERVLVRAAQTLEIPLTFADPWEGRHFAMGLGWLEKSDPIDAGIIRRHA